jgi:hypothetical protein
MKRQAVGHTKMKKLCRILKVPTYVSVGILESLWHLVAREAPLGDIGKLSNEDIAIGIDYDRDPVELVSALIESGWLDPSDKYRLLVHDWHEHADDAIRKSINRSGKEFVTCGKTGKAVSPSIYFIQSPDSGFVKIGFTEGDVHHRLKALQTGNPNTLILLGSITGTKKDELDLHKKFSPLAVNGEWFRLDGPLAEFVRQRLTTADNGCPPEPEPVPVPEPEPEPDKQARDPIPLPQPWNIDPAYLELKRIADESSAPTTPEDWAGAYYHWNRLGPDERAIATQRLQERFLVGGFDPAYFRPQKYLSNGEWKRAVVPPRPRMVPRSNIDPLEALKSL